MCCSVTSVVENLTPAQIAWKQLQIHTPKWKRIPYLFGSDSWIKMCAHTRAGTEGSEYRISWLAHGIVTSENPKQDISDWLIEHRFIRINLTHHTETPTSRSENELRCSEWSDGTVLAPENLHQIVQMVKAEATATKVNGLWVHCMQGIGRTGIFVTALFLEERIRLKQIRSENLIEQLTTLIVHLRHSLASSEFVYSWRQFRSLIDYGNYVLNLPEHPQSVPQTEVPPLPPIPHEIDCS